MNAHIIKYEGRETKRGTERGRGEEEEGRTEGRGKVGEEGRSEIADVNESA